MSFSGNLLAESLRRTTRLQAMPFLVRRIWREDAGDPSAGQPRTWTFLEFEIPDDGVETFADALARALEAGPWFCDFRSEKETFVVFADRIFRYPRGDRSARAVAEDHARSVGVPEAQIDWRA
jgi:hypothetical protein